MKPKEHVADNPEHEDLKADHDQEDREDGERQVLDILEPFEDDIDPDDTTCKRYEETDDPEVKDRTSRYMVESIPIPSWRGFSLVAVPDRA